MVQKSMLSMMLKRNQLLNFIVSLLPYLILFGGMFFFLKMMSNTAGGNNKAFEFGNSRAKLEKNSKTHFSDVAGMDEEKEEVKELVDFLKHQRNLLIWVLRSTWCFTCRSARYRENITC